MSRLTYQVIEGKAVWGGRTLAQWLEPAVERIVEGFSPQQVIVFGSLARGDEGADSDIDLLAVFETIEGRRHDLAAAIQRSLDDIGAPVDVLIADREDLRKRGHLPGVLRVALGEGRVVHERAA